MPTNISFVITVLGADKPGLVESISSAIADHGGNWIESRMAHLAGQFAGIARIDSPAETAAALRAALQQLPGLSIAVVEDQGGAHGGGRGVELELIGPDRPGIVRELSRALASRGVNVEELETECLSAPMSGETLFKANARLAVPDTTKIEELRAALEIIAGELTLDIDLIEP